jgi:hypothetical protein
VASITRTNGQRIIVNILHKVESPPNPFKLRGGSYDMHLDQVDSERIYPISDEPTTMEQQTIFKDVSVFLFRRSKLF